MARKAREPETAMIDAVTHDGRGIAAIAGKKVFVAGALPGEEVRFMRRKRRRNFDEAELLEVLRASADRVPPRCAVFGTCGGCSLQHLPASRQREIKQQALADNLARIGNVVPATWLPPVYDDSPEGGWLYRRRARLAVKDVPGKGRVLVGFRERHAPFITDMQRCEVLAEPLPSLIGPLSELIGQLSIRARVPQIEVAVGDDAVALVFRVLDPPNENDRRLLLAFGATHRLHVLLQASGPDSVVAADTASGVPALHYRLDEFDVDIGFDGLDFIQVNGRVNERMVSRAVRHLQLDRGHRVLDLFCGIGNFTLPIARESAYVLGLEGEARQVHRARANAARNGIDNCEFTVADLSLTSGGESWLQRAWDRLLLDPARSGADAVVRHASRIAAGRIVYVSCHPATLARDARELVHGHGYRLEAAGIIDMFPHTGHVESMAVFDKV